ncbi:DUF5431 family protein, partial [Escherichia coli]
MLRQHQDSLLLRFAQGEEGHETTTQLSCFLLYHSDPADQGLVVNLGGLRTFENKTQ